MNKGLKYLYYIIIAFIAFVGLILIFSVFPVAKYKVMVVQSGSMEPAIKTGSIVIVSQEKDYKKGDVISFKDIAKPKDSITHRIYDLEVIGGKIYYITKGDANNAPDLRRVTQKDIIGKVIVNVPYIGYAVAFARKPIGFMLLLIIPAVLIIFDQMKRIVQEARKIKKQRIRNQEL